MQPLTRDHLDLLVQGYDTPRVSILFSLPGAGAAERQGPAILKNLLRDAGDQLRERGLGRRETDGLLQPGYALVNNTASWRTRDRALAIYLSQEASWSFAIPSDPGQLVVVGDRFHVTPLIDALAADGKFYVLALSQKRVRLYEGSRESIRSVTLNGLPTSLEDALGHDWKDLSLQSHSIAGAGRGSPTSVFHAQGGKADDYKEEIHRFLQRLDSGLRPLVSDGRTPMVLAAVDSLMAAFRHVSHHPRLLSDGIKGNPDDVADRELHARAWEIVANERRSDIRSAAARCRDLLGTGRALADLTEIVPAAVDGRVDQLFVSQDDRRWGRFSESERQVEVHSRPEAMDEELLNLAAHQSLQHGGTVFLLPAEDIPGGDASAAVLRY